MSNYKLTGGNKDELHYTNLLTGTIKVVKLCSDKQFEYLNSLRKELGEEPLKNKPKGYEATAKIDRSLRLTRQQKLL